MDKAEVRKTIKNKRNLLSKKEVNVRSLAISNYIIKNLLVNIDGLKDKKIALYHSSNNEVDPLPIIKYLSEELKNKNIALPKINGKHSMVFKKYTPGEKLKENKEYKNLFEPASINSEIEPDIIFIPLVACDKNGKRIGMGGGFYDKKIAEIKKNDQNITLIGLAYDFQILDNIKAEKHDQSLDFIASQSIIIKCLH
jgi:5-formyltetrahydrofolate cyclo-ligase